MINEVNLCINPKTIFWGDGNVNIDNQLYK
jgi:hypothetical protein